MNTILKAIINITLFLSVTICGSSCFGQNVSISDQKNAPVNTNSVLDIYSSTRGVLLPRVALESANSPVIGEKPTGLLLWNTTETEDFRIGFHFWDGMEWVLIGQDEYVPSVVSHYISDALTAIDADIILDEQLFQSNLNIQELTDIISEMSEIVGTPAQIVTEDRATRAGAGLDLITGNFITPEVVYYTKGATSLHESITLLDKNIDTDIKALATSIVANTNEIAAISNDNSGILNRVSENETSISELQNNVSDLQTSVNQLSSTSQELTDQTLLLEQRVVTNENEIVDLKNQISENTGSIQNNLSLIEGNTNSILELSNRTSSNESKLETIQQQVIDNSEQIIVVNESTQSNLSRITSLEENVTELDNGTTELKNKVSQNTTNITQLEGRITDNETNIGTNSTSIKLVSIDLTNTNIRVDNNFDEIQELKTVTQENSTQIITNSNKIDDLIQNGSGPDLTEEVTKNTEDIVQLQLKTEENSENIGTNSALINTNISRIALVENNTSNQNEKIEQNTLNISTITTEVGVISEEVDENYASIEDLGVHVSENISNIADHTYRIEMLENSAEIPDLTNQVNYNTNEIANLQNDLTDLEAEVTTNKSQISSNYAELDGRLIVLENSSTDLEGLYEQVDQNSTTIEQLIEEGNELENAVSTNTQNITMLGADVTNISKSMQNLEDELYTEIKSLEEATRYNYTSTEVNKSDIAELKEAGNAPDLTEEVTQNTNDINTLQEGVNNNTTRISEIASQSHLIPLNDGIVEANKTIVAGSNKEVAGYKKITIGTDTETTNTAAFEVNSTTQGFLPPRLELNEIKAIKNPAEGLMVYCTSLTKPLFFDGEQWRDFMGNALEYEIGDIVGGGVIYKIESNTLYIVSWDNDANSNIYVDSLEEAKNNNSGGATDWELPNLEDLQLIWNLVKVQGSISGIKFNQESYWSTDSPSSGTQKIMIGEDGSQDTRSETGYCGAKFVREMDVIY